MKSLAGIVALLVLTMLAGTLPACSAPSVDEDRSGADLALSGRAAPGATATATANPIVVTTALGPLQGTQLGAGTAFLGIPFAEPPTGARRFMPPVPAAPWSAVADATHFGAACPQLGKGGITGSEDCLTLNVWTPVAPAASAKPLPVLVWMYGGADFLGGSDMPKFDGQALATADNAIVVSFNYRVGALGFLAHPALAAANPEHTTGNYGLLDAILALTWVQNNIGAFGGDETHVMLFGQSAGAINTCSLLTSPLAHGLFSAVLMESGNCAAESLTYRRARADAVVGTAACSLAPDIVACMQRAPLSALVVTGGVTFLGSAATEIVSTSFDPDHIEDLPFGPTVDGYVLEATPLATIKAGKHNHVPLVIGTNAKEMGFIVPSALFPSVPVASCTEYKALVTTMFPGIVAPLLHAYPCDALDGAAGYRTFVQVVTDGFFTCSSRRALRAAAASQTEPVYRYLFTHGPADHTAEIPYVFGTFAASSVDPTPAETTLSHQMQSYWFNFAASGDPNSGALVDWPAYDPKADDALALDTTIGPVSGIDNAGCNFWDTVQTQ